MDSSAALRALIGTTILVTGAAGFIGQHLCNLLSGHGAVVHGVSRRSQRAGGAVAHWHRVELSDEAAVATMVESVRPTQVIHLAGATSAARTRELLLPTFQANVVSTVNLLNALSKQKPARFVLGGSMEQPIPGEDGQAAPTSPYAASKLAAAGYARMASDILGVPSVVARIFMVYGPGQRELKKLVPYVTLSLLRNIAPKLTGGERSVDWVYVEDVARDLAVAAVAPGLDGMSVDMGSGVATSVQRVVAELAGIIGSNVSPEYAQPAAPPTVDAVADLNRSQRLLGTGARVQLAEGLRRTVDWYRAALAEGRLDVPPL